jgi:hypothetical protein
VRSSESNISTSPLRASSAPQRQHDRRVRAEQVVAHERGAARALGEHGVRMAVPGTRVHDERMAAELDLVAVAQVDVQLSRFDVARDRREDRERLAGEPLRDAVRAHERAVVVHLSGDRGAEVGEVGPHARRCQQARARPALHLARRAEVIPVLVREQDLLDLSRFQPGGVERLRPGLARSRQRRPGVDDRHRRGGEQVAVDVRRRERRLHAGGQDIHARHPGRRRAASRAPEPTPLWKRPNRL